MNKTFFTLTAIVAVVYLFQHSPAYADDKAVQVDEFGLVEKVPAQPAPHWLWIFDPNFISFADGRAHLIDGDSGRYLGSLNTGYVHARLNFPPSYREIYSAETYYSRHVGGTRTDLIRVYDPINLSLIAEIKIPDKRATTIPRLHNTTLSDDGRFMLVFNLTPATSVSVIDVEARSFVGEIEIPGCALVIATGGMRFLSLCGDGSVLLYQLDKHGRLIEKKRSQPFFDADKDPILENGVRYRNQWLFPSVEGLLYSIDISGDELVFPEPWSLLDEQDRNEGWRTGGMQQIAVNAAHGLLYSIMHQGTADTYEHAGPEIWVYELKTKKRIKRIITQRVAISIHVSPDEKPLLFSLPDTEATLDIYDGLSGKHLRTVRELGVTPFLMATPPYKLKMNQ